MATKRAATTATTAAPVKKASAAGSSAAKKSAAKSTASKKAPAKKAATKAPAKAPAKSPAKAAKAPAAAPSKAPAKKAPAARAAAATSATPVKKAPVKNADSATTTPSKAAAKKAPAKKTGAKKSPFDKAFIDAQVKLLQEERATLLTQAVALKAEADALALDREPGDVQFDDESGEGDTLAVERDFDLARAAAAMQTVEEIDAALERVEKGTYGICEYSGEPIPKERLQAIPYARERVEYKTRSFR
jgi:RNA polymerase-binding transcription factor DksA